jgi:hypothetical protein
MPPAKKATAKKASAKKASAKKASAKSAGRKTSPKAQRKIATVMHEFKEGKLVSGGSGKKVKNPKQAIAIALSEAREAGADVPPPPRKKK